MALVKPPPNNEWVLIGGVSLITGNLQYDLKLNPYLLVLGCDDSLEALDLRAGLVLGLGLLLQLSHSASQLLHLCLHGNQVATEVGL